MSSYQNLKKDRDQLSKLWKIAYKAMMKYISKCKEPFTEKDFIIINAVVATGEIMNKHETD